MDPADGIPLTDDGRGVVRVGDTVRKPPPPNADYVRAVLARLASRGVSWSPRALGPDERGRETLSWVDGDVGTTVERWADDQLAEAAALARALHDALAGTPEAAGAETVRHCDLSPWNIVLRDRRPYAFIGFDGARPGRRIDDLGYLAWTFVGVGPGCGPVEEVGRRLRVVCDAYAADGGPRLHGPLVASVLDNQRCILGMRRVNASVARDDAQRAFNQRRAVEIEACIAWTTDHRDQLESALR